jgi:hypothetical protein
MNAEKHFRIYLEGFGFITVRVVVKGRLKPEIFMLPECIDVRVFDVETGKITDSTDLKEYVEKGILEE